MSCDLECWEPKYADTVSKERYEPPEVSVTHVEWWDDEVDCTQSTGTTSGTSSSGTSGADTSQGT